MARIGQTRIARRAMAMARAAFPINLFSVASRERLLEMVKSRYVKSSTTSSVKSPVEILGALLVS